MPERAGGQRGVLRLGQMVIRREGVLPEASFQALLMLERRRAERSRKPFVLMLLDASTLQADTQAEGFLQEVTSTLTSSTRETDLIGWYKQGEILGVIFTEVSLECPNPVTDILHTKVVAALREQFNPSFLSRLRITVHLFPENNEDKGEAVPFADVKLYPELSEKEPTRILPRFLKRVIDIAGSALLLLVFAPLYAAIAIAIKLTSKGPVVFRQNRLGQFGEHFQCLKFRTMYANNDPKIHQEYVSQFIAGQAKNGARDESKQVYKITNDPRVTAVGRFLRKTSLDELPQFWNVLSGQMSLVGPRPPVPYEFKIYDIWHRRRVLEVKPGITGL